MNQKAKELGLNSTNFVTPHGLDEKEHYTTAHELALICDYALKNEVFASIVNTKTYTITINGQPKTLSNTNELLGNLNGVNGVKTGFTNGAGRCLVTSTTRNGHQIICVVLGADTKKIRTADSIKLIEYAFSNYEYVNVKEKLDNEFRNWLQQKAPNIHYEKAKQTNQQYELEESNITWMPILKNQQKDLQISIDYKTSIEAPQTKGENIGQLKLKLGEEVLLTRNILLKQDVDKKQIGDYLEQFSKNYCKYVLETIWN